jgi:hypothetical protein
VKDNPEIIEGLCEKVLKSEKTKICATTTREKLKKKSLKSPDFEREMELI